MKDVTVPEVILAIFLFIAACGLLARGATLRPPIPTPMPTLEATEPLPTELPTELPVALETPIVTATAGIPVTGAVIVQVRNLGKFGPALVDSDGLSLYVFTGNAQNHSPGSCSGEECLENWTPFLASGKPVAGPGVDSHLLGTIIRTDGTIQVTYNGLPLYHLFPTDKAPGDVTGQADDKEWYLVSPSGDPIRSPGSD